MNHEAVRILAAAFTDDPVMRWVFPVDTHQRLLALWPAVAEGTVDVSADGGAAAIWRAPGEVVEGDSSALLSAATPDELERLGSMDAAMTAVHPTEPHWYLLAIGADPCGGGRGGALLAAGLERAGGQPAYLESSNPRNVSLYRRHGFEVTGTITGHGGPPFTTMWRPGADG